MDGSPHPSGPPASGPRAVGARRVAGFPETVFATYTRLAAEHRAVNLGQGFPDFDPPGFVLEALRDSAAGPQQYAPLPGLPALREAVARDAARELGRDVDPLANVQITVGATEALFAALQALLDPGDEVVGLEPAYDAYPAQTAMAGGRWVGVPLEPDADGGWTLDLDRLRAAVGPRTRVILLNTPHNPTGRILSATEIDAIARMAEEADAWIVSDEVYARLAFAPFASVASRPSAAERTLTVSSFGKTFSATGWKIGWAVGPEPLVAALRRAHQWIPFAVATPLQAAAAAALTACAPGGAHEGYYDELRAAFERRRDLLVRGLRGTPFRPLVPDGGYFVMADATALGYPDDVALCDALPARAGVAAIPPSAFYAPERRALAAGLVRFAFCKSDEAIAEGVRRLQALEGAAGQGRGRRR